MSSNKNRELSLILNFDSISKYLDYYTRLQICFLCRELKNKVSHKVLSTFSTNNQSLTHKLLDENQIISKIIETWQKHLKVIYLEFKSIEDNHIFSISKLELLQELSINGCHQVTDQFFEYFSERKENLILTKLELYWMPQITKIISLLQVPGLVSNIETLNLSGCKNLEDSNFSLIAEMINLKYLDLTRCSSIKNSQLQNIVQKCQKLKNLCLYALPHISGVFMQHLSSNLEYLDVCGNTSLEDRDITELKCYQLKYLNLVSYSQIINTFRLGALNLLISR